MIINNPLTIFCFCIGLPFFAKTQSRSIKVGLELPTQLSIGIEERFHEAYCVYGQIGLVTFPLDKATIGLMKIWNAPDNLLKVMEPAYRLGMVLNLGASYYFSRSTRMNYCGPVIQWFRLANADIPEKPVNDYFEVDLSGPDFPLGPIPISMSKEPLTLKSNYLQLGMVIGQKINFYRQDRRELRIELAMNKNIYSRHTIESDYRYLGSFQKRFNNEFKDMYKKFAIFPSINIYYIYKFQNKRFRH